MIRNDAERAFGIFLGESCYNAAMSRLRLSTTRTAVLALALTAICGPGLASAEPESIQSLEVHTAPRGGVLARATLYLTAPLATVQAVLTDYEGWSELFPGSMRVARVERQRDRTITDLYFFHSLLPGEWRLLLENRELPGGGLAKALLGGDFKRFIETWTVGPDGSASGTKAEFRMDFEVDTLVPDWLVARVLKGELGGYFRALKEKTERWARPSPLR